MATATDPVCGMKVETEGARFTHEHNGTVYYFCARGCMLDFQDEPEKFLAPDHRPQGMPGHGGTVGH
jgi:P-type Cu+ transporter